MNNKIILLNIPIWISIGILCTLMGNVSILILWIAIMGICMLSYQVYDDYERIERILIQIKEVCEKNGITKK